MLSESLRSARRRLSSKLAQIDLGSLGISEYNIRYLAGHLRNLEDVF